MGTYFSGTAFSTMKISDFIKRKENWSEEKISRYLISDFINELKTEEMYSTKSVDFNQL